MPSRNPKFTKILDRMMEIHDKKSHDYAKDSIPYSNFEYAALVAEPFTNPVDKVFAVMLGIKLARLAELRTGKLPINESVIDSFIDLANYSAIWASYRYGGGNASEVGETEKDDVRGTIESRGRGEDQDGDEQKAIEGILPRNEKGEELVVVFLSDGEKVRWDDNLQLWIDSEGEPLEGQ